MTAEVIYYMDMEEVIELSNEGHSDKAIMYIPINNIITNPFQPRKNFDMESLRELSESIKEFGVLQPLLVVPLEEEQYLLIAGERRLRASFLAELETVPVILGNYTSQEVAEIAMIENLQREDLHYLDEAEGYDLLMKEFNLTQEALAKRVGKKQSTIANKIRILKLDKSVRELLGSNQLTERHARALLRLDNVEDQITLLKAVIENELNVRQTEELIESFINQAHIIPTPEIVIEEKTGKRTRVIRDVRIFVNSIKKVVTDIKKSGVTVKLQQAQTETELVLTMKIPLNKKK